MQAGQDSQLLPLVNVAQFNDNPGGLDLAQALATIRRQAHLIAGVTLLVASAAVFKSITDTPVYKAKFELLTEPVTLETQVISSTNPESLSSREEIVAVELDEAKLKILKSPSLMSPIVAELQAKYPDISYDSVVENLTITANASNSILEVTYQDSDPQQVQDVLDLVARSYLKYSLESRQTDISRGIQFLEGQLPQLRSRVDSLQERLQKLRQESNLIDPTTQSEQLSEQIGLFVQQRLEVQAQLSEAQRLTANLQEELAQPIELASASALSNPRYQELLDQILEIDAQVAKESVLFFEESPEIKILQEQRQRLLPLLRQEGQRVYRGGANRIQELQIREQALNETIDRLNQQIKQLTVTTRQYTDLQRELDIATNNLNQFVAKREALRIDAAQRESPWELLTPPGEPDATSASVKKNLVLGTMLGLLLGIGAALGLDKLGDIIHSSKKLKEVTQLPLLGIVPLSKTLEASAIDGDVLTPAAQNQRSRSGNHLQLERFSFMIESFRSLYANIRLLNPDRPIRSFVISSAMPGEGKSTVAIHLAKTAAAMGRRVLLVDADLRSPRLHSRLEISNWQGLTDVIAKNNLDFNDVIQRASLDQLFVLTSGPIPPDPIRLLGSEKMQHLMREWQATFDLVIYDAPSLFGLADAHLLAASTDGVALVAGLGKLKRSLLEQTLEQINTAHTPILGVVANRAKDAPLSLYGRQEPVIDAQIEAALSQ